MSTEVKCNECADGKVFTNESLRRHKWNSHTLIVWTSIDGEEKSIAKENGSFQCPWDDCIKSYRTTQKFSEHIKTHGITISCLNPTTIKLGKRASETPDLEPPQDTAVILRAPSPLDADDLVVSPKKIKIEVDYNTAVLAACDALSLPEQEQQDKIMLASVARLRPVMMITDENQHFHVLTAASISTELATQPQRQINFLLPVKSTIEPAVNGEPSFPSDAVLDHIIAISGLSHILDKKNFVEMDTNTANLINHDWTFYPALRYATSQLFAGAILLSGTKGLLLNCIESYGRMKSVDALCEHFLVSPVKSSSIPFSEGLYPGIKIMMQNYDSTEKLVIGTRVSNLLVTSSISLTKDPVIEVGATTKNFEPSDKTRIYLDVASMTAAKNLIEQGNNCSHLYTFDFYAQLRQIRSKFDCPSAYVRCRASSDITNNSLGRPYTVWTLFDNATSPESVSQARMASRLFQEVALQVIRNPDDAKLSKSTVQRIIDSNGQGGNQLQDILGLFDDIEFISIIGNKDLNKIMKQLAQDMASALKTANEKVALQIKDLVQ